MDINDKLETIFSLVEPISTILSLICVAILFWGFVVGIANFVYIEFFHRDGKFIQYQQLRRTMGVYIILGLEFLIVSDLLDSMQQKTYRSVIMLGALVVIRTTISFFLGKEMKEASEEERDFKLGLRPIQEAQEQASMPMPAMAGAGAKKAAKK